MGDSSPITIIDMRIEMRIKVSDIIKRESARTGISMDDILGEKRNADLCHLRHYIMWLAKIETGLSYPQIGRAFGNKDHTTILHGVKKIEAMPLEKRRWDPPKDKVCLPVIVKDEDDVTPKNIFPIRPIYKVA